MEITLGGVYNESISRWVPNSPIPQDTGLICLYLAQPYRDSFNVLVYLFHDTAYLASLSVMICSIIACRTDIEETVPNRTVDKPDMYPALKFSHFLLETNLSYHPKEIPQLPEYDIPEWVQGMPL